MAQHFEGKYEVELKFRLPCRQSFLDTLRTLNAKVRFEDNIEYDRYYDRKDGALAGANKHVIIRDIQPVGIMLWIVKGPEADRCEAVDITDAERADSMLRNMGYDVVLELKKQRSIYFINEFHLTLDHLEGIGDFAEFAIMTDKEEMLESYHQQLTELARQFGLGDDQLEHRSYRQLQLEAMQNR